MKISVLISVGLFRAVVFNLFLGGEISRDEFREERIRVPQGDWNSSS